MKRTVLLLSAFLLACFVAQAQTTDFFNAIPDEFYNYNGSWQNTTPWVGARAACDDTGHTQAGVSVQLNQACGYVNYANMNAGTNTGTGNWRLYSAGYQEVYDPNHPLFLVLDYTYESNCDCHCIITDYYDPYSCP